MIQRIQSVYLSLTIIFSVLFLSGKMMRFTDEAGHLLYVTISGLKRISGSEVVEQLEKVLPLVIILIFIALLAFVTIFLFQNRKLQMKLSGLQMILSVIMIFCLTCYIYAYSSNYNAKFNLTLNLFYPLLILVSSILAYRGIRKDQEIVKSYERLR